MPQTTVAKPLLFSIHGIRTTGPWQEGSSVVLSPFYRYIPIKYDEFREWAIPKLAMDLLVLLLGAAAAMFLWYLEVLPGINAWCIYVVGVLTSVLILNVVADRLRGRVIEKVYRRVADAALNDTPPNLIAHSLGTFLSSMALRKFQGLRYNTVILNGCVLERRFPWARMRLRYESVTNEVGWNDLVPYAATVLSCLVPGMGCAGSRGFKGHNNNVHNVTPEEEYPNCRSQKCPCEAHANIAGCDANIHNVHHEKLEHSDYFKGLTHAWHFWLPTLWGYDPMLYQKFKEACLVCYRNEIADVLPDVQDKAVEDLKGSCWGWTKGPLNNFVRQQILNRAEEKRKQAQEEGKELPPQPQMFEVDLVTNLVICATWGNISLAAAESQKLEGRDEYLLEQLEPRKALKCAIDAAAVKFSWLS
ncbi:MAG: hypothetical protein ACJ71W_17885 [Terriglobales bacterium]